MDKQKRILEMAKDICRVKQICNDVCNPISACDALKYAERAVEAGYSKQSKGEIKGIFRFGDECWLGWCSECGKELKGRTKIALTLEHRFCPNCGAKMKGGAE